MHFLFHVALFGSFLLERVEEMFFLLKLLCDDFCSGVVAESSVEDDVDLGVE